MSLSRMDLARSPLVIDRVVLGVTSAEERINSYTGPVPLEQARADVLTLFRARVIESALVEEGAPVKERQNLVNERRRYKAAIQDALRGNWERIRREVREEVRQAQAGQDINDPGGLSDQMTQSRRYLLESLNS